MECLNGLVNDRTAENVVRPNPNGSAICTERSAEQFGRTSGQKYGKIWAKNWQKIGKRLWYKILPHSNNICK